MGDRHQAQAYPLRLPPELKQAVAASAEASGRSFNSEVIARLEASFKPARGDEDMRAMLKEVLALLAKTAPPAANDDVPAAKKKRPG